MTLRLAVALATTLLFAALPAVAARSVIVTSQDHSLEGGDDCASFHTQNTTSFAANVTAQEQRDFSIPTNQLVRVVASDEGGVSVRGWDRADARLLICKCAAADTPQKARHILDAVTITVKDGVIRAAGPDINESQIWWAHLILQLPKKTKVAVDSSNGGIAVRNVHGGIVARTTNGGISLDRVTGNVEATTENGPISLKVRQKVLPSIVARTEDSGMIVCNLAECAGGSGAWTANRKQLHLAGSGTPIRLTTTGAPIIIEQVR
jgi:hypothetical protein